MDLSKTGLIIAPPRLADPHILAILTDHAIANKEKAPPRTAASTIPPPSSLPPWITITEDRAGGKVSDAVPIDMASGVDARGEDQAGGTSNLYRAAYRAASCMIQTIYIA